VKQLISISRIEVAYMQYPAVLIILPAVFKKGSKQNWPLHVNYKISFQHSSVYGLKNSSHK